MKNYFLISMMLLALLFTGCSAEFEEVQTPKVANTNVVFDIVQTPITRAASVGDNWPTTDSKTQALSVVDKVYSTPKNAGISFFTSNYSVKLTNDKGGSITAWDGSTGLSLTETNTITVTLTENTAGAFPKFKTATGTVNVANVDFDTATPDKSKAVCTGAISVLGITNDNGTINVTIQVSLEYDSYLLVAPEASYSILTNVKGFTELKWGSSAGADFNTTTSTNGKTWFYYWGTGNEYVWGKGSYISYGFNLYSDGSQDIKVENGKWYGLFAAWSSAGEGDDNGGADSTDKDKTHTVGGTNGVTPTANDVATGGTIR